MKVVALLSLVHTLRKWKATDPSLGIRCRRAHEERAMRNSSLTVPEKKKKTEMGEQISQDTYRRKIGPSEHLRFGTILISTQEFGQRVRKKL